MIMNRAARLSILAAYAAAAAWALAPAPPKPLAATIAPPPPPPRYERQYRPEPPPIPRERIEPDEYRGSLNEAPQQTALHPPETYTGAGYYPHGLKTEMDEADHFAIATLRIKQLPPVEFDHALAGPVEVIDIESEERLRQLCHMTQTHQGVNVIGCAGRKPDRCVIYLGPIPASSGITRNINLRHELGHCNGWPADHAGIR
jgi:hypothetical protein